MLKSVYLSLRKVKAQRVTVVRVCITQTTEVRRHRDRRRSPLDVAEFFDRLNRRQPINQVGLTSQDLRCQQQSECLKEPLVQPFLYCDMTGMRTAGQASLNSSR